MHRPPNEANDAHWPDHASTDRYLSACDYRRLICGEFEPPQRPEPVEPPPTPRRRRFDVLPPVD